MVTQLLFFYLFELHNLSLITYHLSLIALGCIGGFLFGMVGIGGNVLYIPIFGYLLAQMGFLDADLSRAVVANALLVLVFTGSVAAWKQYRVGNFFLKEVLLTAATGILMAFSISLLIQSGDWYNKKVFDVVFAGILSLMLLRMGNEIMKELRNERINSKKILHSFIPSFLHYLLVGFLTGSLTAFSGLGGGIIMIPLFTAFLGLPIKKAHSIAVCVVPLLATTISVFYFLGKPNVFPIPYGQFGYLNLGMAGPVILGSILTAPFGVKAAHTVKPRTQKLIFGVILCVVLIKMIYGFVVR